jgi:hypothetical protein
MPLNDRGQDSSHLSWYRSYWLLQQVVRTNMKQLIKTFIYPAPHPL